jgi:hypothetical protein
MPELNPFVAHWRKSSRSSDSNTCVEVAFACSSVAVRDSKDPGGPTLVVPAHAFTNLIGAARPAG